MIPLISIFFRYQNIFETQASPLRKFSVLWDKNIPTESRDTLLLSTDFLYTRIFLKNWKVPLRISSVLWDKKSFGGESWYPLIMHTVFRYPYFSIKSKGSTTKLFGNLRHKHFALTYLIFFAFQKFSETPKVSLTKFSGTLRPKNIRGTSWYPPIKHKVFFGYPKVSEKSKGSPMNFFGTVRQRNFDGKSWYPLDMDNVFWIPEAFWHFEGFPAENFGTKFSDIKFQTVKRDTPPLIHNFISTRNFLKKRRVPLRTFFGTERAKSFDGNSWEPSC